MNTPECKEEQPHFTMADKDVLASAGRVFRTDDLFGSASEIGIAHNGSLYRLRVTRTGKLILTK